MMVKTGLALSGFYFFRKKIYFSVDRRHTDVYNEYMNNKTYENMKGWFHGTRLPVG
jgi:hypothetical protein